MRSKLITLLYGLAGPVVWVAAGACCALIEMTWTHSWDWFTFATGGFFFLIGCLLIFLIFMLGAGIRSLKTGRDMEHYL